MMKNEIFNIRRFFALAKMYYRENLGICLIFLAVMVMITFLYLEGPQVFVKSYIFVANQNELDAVLEEFKQSYAAKFWGLLIFFSVCISFYAFRGIRSRTKMVRTLMLPASNFEKYMLALLNSTLVPLIVFALMFYSIAFITGMNKYVGVKGAHIVEGKLMKENSPDFTGQNKNFRIQIGNIFSLQHKPIKFEIKNENGEMREVTINPVIPVWGWHFVVLSWLFLISVSMWGAVSFQKRTLLYTILVHMIFYALLGIGLVYVIYRMCEVFEKTPALEGLSFSGGTVNREIPSACWILFLYLFPLVYQLVIWMKLKTKQVNS